MPTVEVDEEEVRQNHRLRQTIATLMADPDTKLSLQKLVKKKFPTASTPELDAAEAVEAKQGSVSKEIDELKAQIAKDKQERDDRERLTKLNSDFEGGFERLRQAGWQKDGIDAVRKVMEEKGILDHDIAVAYIEKLHPPQSPLTPGGQGAWNFMDQVADDETDLKKMIETKGENGPLLDKLVRETLNDVRGNPPRR